MSGYIYVNGQFCNQIDASLSVFDRGHLFGDGCYEVIPVYGGQLVDAKRHWRRIANNLQFLQIRAVDLRVTALIVDDLIWRNRVTEGHVYLQVTRGAAIPRTHAFPKPGCRPTLFMMTRVHELMGTHAQQQGVKVTIEYDQRSELCAIKTVNLLPNVLAKQRAVSSDATEALLVRDQEIFEGSSMSFWLVKDGDLYTPPLTKNILPGVTRAVVIDLARDQGLVVRECRLFLEDLQVADEVFLTSATQLVLPVTRVDRMTVGGKGSAGAKNGQEAVPGPVTKRLQQMIYDHVKSHAL